MKQVLRQAALAFVLVPVAALGAAPGAAPGAAMAQVQTYYHAGAWDAFSGRTEKGGAVCGVGTTMPPDNRRLTISYDIGGTDTNFSVSKPDWAIPDNTGVRLVMQIGLNTPWTEQAGGRQHAIDWTLDPGAMETFDQQFRVASSMTLTFPDGNEPPWAISLAGSSAVLDTFDRCVRDLTQQVEAAQAPTSGVAAMPGATQPFSPTASPPAPSGSPASAAPASAGPAAAGSGPAQ